MPAAARRAKASPPILLIVAQPADVSDFPLVKFTGPAAAPPSNRSPNIIHEEKLRDVVKEMASEAYQEFHAKKQGGLGTRQ